MMKQLKNNSFKRQSGYLYIGALLLLMVLMAWLLRGETSSKAAPAPTATTTYRAGQTPDVAKKLLHLTGGGPALSQPFSVPAHWDVYWDYLCNEAVSPGYFNVTVLNTDGNSTPLPPINSLGISGFGDQKYELAVGQVVKLDVTSNCTWHLTATAESS